MTTPTTATTTLSTRTLRLGTRASALALVQARGVADALSRVFDVSIELVKVSTVGDRSAAPIEALGSVGVFTSALRDALLNGEIDLAVHSYKDLPTDRDLPAASPLRGLTIAAVPVRAVAHDVLVTADGSGLFELPPGARIGTGAPRRVAQLRAARPDLRCEPLRGNVDTRLEKVFGGELDAVVLAAAALARLGRHEVVGQQLAIDVMMPAPAQGALAVECRLADTTLVELLSTVDDPPTRAAVLAERTVLATLEAGCMAPLGAYCLPRPGSADGHGGADAVKRGGSVDIDADTPYELHAAVISIDGAHELRRSTHLPYHQLAGNAAAVGSALAAELLDAGAATLLSKITAEIQTQQPHQ